MMGLLAEAGRASTPGSVDEVLVMFASAFLFGSFLLMCKGVWWIAKGQAQEEQRKARVHSDYREYLNNMSDEEYFIAYPNAKERTS